MKKTILAICLLLVFAVPVFPKDNEIVNPPRPTKQYKNLLVIKKVPGKEGPVTLYVYVNQYDLVRVAGYGLSLRSDYGDAIAYDLRLKPRGQFEAYYTTTCTHRIRSHEVISGSPSVISFPIYSVMKSGKIYEMDKNVEFFVARAPKPPKPLANMSAKTEKFPIHKFPRHDDKPKKAVVVFRL